MAIIIIIDYMISNITLIRDGLQKFIFMREMCLCKQRARPDKKDPYI